MMIWVIYIYIAIGSFIWAKLINEYFGMTSEERVFYYEGSDINWLFVLGTFFRCITIWPLSLKATDHMEG